MTRQRLLRGCGIVFAVVWLAFAGVFYMLVTDSQGFFNKLEELVEGKKTPIPRSTMSAAGQAAESAMLPDWQVNYGFETGCPNDNPINLKAWAAAVEDAANGVTDQTATEQRLVQIIQDQGGYATCMASIKLKSIHYDTYDQFARATYGMPQSVSISDIYELHQLAYDHAEIQAKGGNPREVYEDVVRDQPKAAALWLIRRMPVYDEEDGWMTFDSYARKLDQDLNGVDPNSRFGQDPLGTTFDIMMGDYDSMSEVVGWIGVPN